MDNIWSQIAHFAEWPNLLMYTMEIQVLVKFQLKITKLGYDIAQKIILPHIWALLFQNCAQNMKT